MTRTSFGPASAGTIAEIALKRLRHLCEANPLFEPVHRAAEAIGRKGASDSLKAKTRPDYRAVVAAVWGTPTYNDIGPLQDNEFDETVGASALVERRQQQSGRLAEFLAKTATDQNEAGAEDPLSYASDIIDEWQPTARQPEAKVKLAYEILEDVLQHFGEGQIRMDFANRWGHEPLLEDVERARTALRLVDPAKLNPRQEQLRQRLMADMGMIAVRLGNSDDESKRKAALHIFESLFRLGQSHAGVHVARMRFEGWGRDKKGRDMGGAHAAIDRVFAVFTSGNPDVFQNLAGLEEMLTLRFRIKHELIVAGKKDPEIVFKRTKELIHTLQLGLANGLDAYGNELAAILDPMNPHPHELRSIIDSHPTTRDYCLQMHNNLCAQMRAAGFVLPEPPAATRSPARQAI